MRFPFREWQGWTTEVGRQAGWKVQAAQCQNQHLCLIEFILRFMMVLVVLSRSLKPANRVSRYMKCHVSLYSKNDTWIDTWIGSCIMNPFFSRNLSQKLPKWIDSRFLSQNQHSTSWLVPSSPATVAATYYGLFLCFRGQLKGLFVTPPMHNAVCPNEAGYTWKHGDNRAGRGLVVRCKTGTVGIRYCDYLGTWPK